MARKRGGYGTGEFRYTETVKMRLTAWMYQDLIKLQESTRNSMAGLLRELIGPSIQDVKRRQTGKR